MSHLRISAVFIPRTAGRAAQRARGVRIAAALALAAAGTFLAAAPAAGQMIYAQIPDPGESFTNACEETPLHAAPNGYAEVVATAAFGETFEVVEVTGKYLLPKSMRYSTTHGSSEDAFDRQRGRLEHHPKDFFPAWAEVKTGGGTAFISMRCMVTPEFAEQQNAENAERKFEQAAIVDGGKGFGLKPASGGSGKGLAGQLAALGEDRGAVEALLNRQTSNPQEAFRAFREAGGVGEFAAKIDDPDLRDKPARDVKREPEGDLGDALGGMFGN